MLARVSNIEAYRRWRDWRPLHDNDEEPTVEELVRDIVTDNPSEAMQAGTAFHAALEAADVGEHDALSAMGYTFHFADGDIALPDIRELRTFRDYGALTVTGKADCVSGRTVIDHKSTSRFDPDRYVDGWQWRFYLELFGADTFTWNVFVIKETDPKVYRVAAPQPLTVYRYPGIERDCATLAAEYLAFASAHLPAGFDPIASEKAAA